MNFKIDHLRLEDFFLKIFRYTVLTAMTMALLALPVLLLGAAYFYLQTPHSPPSIEEMVNKELSVDRIKKNLIDEEKSKDQNNQGNAPKLETPQPSKLLQYTEQALGIYKCGDDLKRASGITVEMVDSSQMAQQVEQIRATLEKLAEDPQKGTAFVNGISVFTCKVLRDSSIAQLKKDGKIGQVIIPTLKTYTEVWNDAQSKVNEYIASEITRCAEAKLVGILMAQIALALFGSFLLLAIYLMLSRVENHFSNINHSILEVGGKQKNLLD